MPREGAGYSRPWMRNLASDGVMRKITKPGMGEGGREVWGVQGYHQRKHNRATQKRAIAGHSQRCKVSRSCCRVVSKTGRCVKVWAGLVARIGTMPEGHKKMLSIHKEVHQKDTQEECTRAQGNADPDVGGRSRFFGRRFGRRFGG